MTEALIKEAAMSSRTPSTLAYVKFVQVRAPYDLQHVHMKEAPSTLLLRQPGRSVLQLAVSHEYNWG